MIEEGELFNGRDPPVLPAAEAGGGGSFDDAVRNDLTGT
jgi:hypothetical protein